MKKPTGGSGGEGGRGLKTRVKTARKRSLSSTLWLQRQLNDPYVARATYPALGFPQYAGEVGWSDADPAAKAAAQKAAVAAVAEPLEVFHKFYMSGKPFIGGAEPSIADIRLAATLEFLAVIDYPLPAWAKSFMSAIESKLGAAYSEPAADVRGYVAHMKSQTH